MPEIDDILNQFGVALVTDLRESLVRHKVIFGGGGESKLSAKIKYEIVQSADTITFNLIMPEYGEYVDEGRGKGPVSKDGQKSISDWATRKGIVGKFQNENLATRVKKQADAKAKITARKKHKTLRKLSFDKAVKALTFLIARKIKRDGYKPTHFFTEVLQDGRVEVFRTELQKVIKQKVLIEIK